MHHVAFATHEKHNILAICDKLGALRQSDKIERGPGRHGVSNAFYLYLRDPDGHRVEIYTQDYYTGDPDNPVVTWTSTTTSAATGGHPRGPLLVHGGVPGPGPGRQPAGGRLPHGRLRARRDHRRGRLLLHAPLRGRESMPDWKKGEYKMGHQL